MNLHLSLLASIPLSSLTHTHTHTPSIAPSIPLSFTLSPSLPLYLILSHTLSTPFSLSLSLSLSMFSTYPFSSTPYLIMTPIICFIASHSHLFDLPFLHLYPPTHHITPLILHIHFSIHQSSLSPNHHPLPPLHLIPLCHSSLVYCF